MVTNEAVLARREPNVPWCAIYARIRGIRLFSPDIGTWGESPLDLFRRSHNGGRL